MVRQRKYGGFTIVELLIVIVVIAILAAISIIAFNGVQSRAVESTLQSDLKNAATQLGVYQADNGSYPLTASLNPNTGLKKSTGVSFEYTSDGQTYCLTALSSRAGISPYHSTHGGAATKGACAGHSTTPPSSATIITNHSRNPGAETILSPITGTNGATSVRSSARAHSGSQSVYVTMPRGSGFGQYGVSIFPVTPLTTYLKPNTTYTVSAYVYVPSGTGNVQINMGGSGRSSTVNPSGRLTSVKDSWVRIHNEFTTAADGDIMVYVVNASPTTSDTTVDFYIDSIMVTEGSQLYPYADGSSQDWSWVGTPNASASTGPSS